MATKRTVGILGGLLGILAGIGLGIGVGILSKDTDTDIVLKEGTAEEPCGVDKANTVVGHAGKKVRWWIYDDNCDRDVTITIGNFRTAEKSSATDCEAATQGGTTFPFTGNETAARRKANAAGKIDLKLRSSGLGREYYYDVCISSGGKHVMVDPKLLIDP